jgi:hypothetical protein
VDRSIELDELGEKWTLLGDEQRLVAGKRGATKLGSCAAAEVSTFSTGSSPRGRSALPDDAVWFVADQVKVPVSDLKVSASAASRAGKRRDLTRCRF